MRLRIKILLELRKSKDFIKGPGLPCHVGDGSEERLPVHGTSGHVALDWFAGRELVAGPGPVSLPMGGQPKIRALLAAEL